MPKYGYPSEVVIGNDCCHNDCVLKIRRQDVLTSRHLYMQFYNKFDELGKRESRYFFISTLVRTGTSHFQFTPVNLDVPVCPTLLSRIFGFSEHVLMNGLIDCNVNNYTSRPWYQKTIDILSSAMLALSKSIQFNSLSQLMLPPKFSSRSAHPDGIGVPVSVIRKRMDLKVRERKADTLTRCVACCTLPIVIKNAKSESEKREGRQHLQAHHLVVSQQRAIVKCLTEQSRDPDSDVSVCLIDAMSNKTSKLPHLLERAKIVTDCIRLNLTLTTVQLAETFGTYEYRNIEFPMIQSHFHHDSNYNCSVLLNGISKFKTVSSTVFVILDSSRNNKSFVFLGGLGLALSRLTHIQKIVLVYPSVGHTHLSVDAHFGAVSKAMGKVEKIRDPIEYKNFLNTIPSVGQVEDAPTVYDFSFVSDHMFKPAGLCSNGVISIARNPDGLIHYASSLTMNATQLVGGENNEACRKLFKDSFYTSKQSPMIQTPNCDELTTKIDKMIKESPIYFTPVNEENYKNILANTGRTSFQQLVSQINSIPKKVPVMDFSSTEDMQMSVLSFLEKNGINAGRVPKTPVVDRNQLMN